MKTRELGFVSYDQEIFELAIKLVDEDQTLRIEPDPAGDGFRAETGPYIGVSRGNDHMFIHICLSKHMCRKRSTLTHKLSLPLPARMYITTAMFYQRNKDASRKVVLPLMKELFARR